MPFEQLKQLAEHLGKLQGDLLRQVGTEPYAGFSEQMRQIQDSLTQAQGHFSEGEALEQAAEEAAARAAAAEAAEQEAAAAAAAACAAEEPPCPPPQPDLPVADKPDAPEDGSVWKVDWSTASESSSSGVRPPAKSPKSSKPKPELWDDLSERG